MRRAGQFINERIDRTIGLNGLRPELRERLLRRQLTTIMQMTPVLLAGSLAVSAVFVFLLARSGRPLEGLAWAIAVNAIYLRGVFIWLSMRRDGPGQGLRAHAVLATLGYVGALGVLWSVPALMLMGDGDPVPRTAMVIGIGTMLCASMTAFANYPQALFAFVVPLFAGLAVAIFGFGTVADAWVLGGMVPGVLVIMVAVSLRHGANFVALRVSEYLVNEKHEIIGLLLREFEDRASDWLWGLDRDGILDRVSGGFLTATGVGEDALIGADFIHFLRCITAPEDTVMAEIEAKYAARATFRDVEIRVTAGGQECWWALTGKPVFDENGDYAGYIGTGSDVTERRIADRRITALAHHDPLTGLYNRTKFTEHLNHCVARLERYGTPFSVLFLDLDQFKRVNDSRGHMVGDTILTQVSRRIRALARESDYPARLGGDEFAVILTEDCRPERCAELAGRLIEDIGAPFTIDEQIVTVGASIGIAMAPLDGTRADQILRNADLALYRAKDDGRAAYRFFESQMDSEARARRALEMELREALANGEMVLHYQPLVSATERTPTGFEALIRWNHPTRGLVPPSEFIPLAEQSDLIVAIGDWTIHQACMAAAVWPEGLTVAVNLSARHFRTSDIALTIKKALTLSGLDPRRLEIEITERLLMDDPEAVTARLEEIRALGVTIAMDDFGTGYSSLAYLLKFPFDKIKIDKSFVDASSRDAVARDILKAIAALGRTLRLKITAEGVETAEQVAFLSEIACHQLQGFYFARPLDGMDLPHYLLTQVPTRARQVKAEAEAALRGHREAG